MVKISDVMAPLLLLPPPNLCFLHQDDWYILDAEKDSHVLVVYRGSNDAWDGYGGGTLYTKARKTIDRTSQYVPYGLVAFFLRHGTLGSLCKRNGEAEPDSRVHTKFVNDRTFLQTY